MNGQRVPEMRRRSCGFARGGQNENGERRRGRSVTTRTSRGRDRKRTEALGRNVAETRDRRKERDD